MKVHSCTEIADPVYVYLAQQTFIHLSIVGLLDRILLLSKYDFKNISVSDKRSLCGRLASGISQLLFLILHNCLLHNSLA
jgi:hypothetical protein